jgi:hypothetical protein
MAFSSRVSLLDRITAMCIASPKLSCLRLVEERPARGADANWPTLDYSRLRVNTSELQFTIRFRRVNFSHYLGVGTGEMMDVCRTRRIPAQEKGQKS